MSPILTISEGLQSFMVEDVTENPEKCDIAFTLVGEGYARLSSGALDPRTVCEELCNDAYHQHGLTRTLLLTGWNPTSQQIEPLGTVRAIVGSHRAKAFELLPLEAMTLLTPQGGWGNFTFEGFNYLQAAEFGRFSLAANCRTEVAQRLRWPALVMRKLVEAGAVIANTYGKTQLWMTLPSYLRELTESGGMILLPVPHLTLQHEHRSALFKKYDRYWLQSHPWFYRLIVPFFNPSRTDAVTTEFIPHYK